MGEAFHCPAREYDGDALVELEPALRPGLAGGWYYHDDAHLRPDKLMQAWRRVLEAGGATIRENCAFQGFQCRNGRALAAATAQGELAGRHVRRRGRCLDAPVERSSRLPRADPAGQGI